MSKIIEIMLQKVLQKPKMRNNFFRGRFGPDTEAERVLKMVQKVNSGKVQNKGVVIAHARAEKRWHLRCNYLLQPAIFFALILMNLMVSDVEIWRKIFSRFVLGV